MGVAALFLFGYAQSFAYSSLECVSELVVLSVSASEALAIIRAILTKSFA